MYKIFIDKDIKKTLIKVFVIIFSIILLNIIFANKETLGVTFAAFNTKNNKQLKNGDTIECPVGEKIVLNLCADHWNALHMTWTKDNLKYFKSPGDKCTNPKTDYDFTCQITYVAMKVGTDKIKIGAYTYIDGFFNDWGLDEEYININIKATKNSEMIENENLEDYYTKDLNKMTSFADQLMYLRSILYNDGKNGNTKLWDKFVAETTAEQRQSWYKNITYHSRDSAEKIQSAINVLKSQIDKDEADKDETKTKKEKEEAESKLKENQNKAQNAQSKTYKKNKQRILAYQFDSGEPREEFEFIDVLENTDYYTNVGDIDSSDADKVEEKVGTILSVITNIGILLSVIMPAILGIKYMLGSVEEKAEYKRDMIPYLVGAVLLFGVCTVVKILQAIGNSINNI